MASHAHHLEVKREGSVPPAARSEPPRPQQSEARPRSAAPTSPSPLRLEGAAGLSADAAEDRPLSNAPLTARAFKSSLQLRKELKDVGGQVERIAKRVEQALAVTRGTIEMLSQAGQSVRKSLAMNPSVSRDDYKPPSPSAARAALVERTKKRLERKLDREPTWEEVHSAVTAEAFAERKEARQREEANAPVIEALEELEEGAELGIERLQSHEDTLTRMLEQLGDTYGDLGTHYSARDRVVKTTDRSRMDRLKDGPTHEALRVAGQREDSSRYASNMAVKAAREEQSTLQARKADVQRSVQERRRIEARFMRNERAGTSFRGWTKDEIALGGGGTTKGPEERRK